MSNEKLSVDFEYEEAQVEIGTLGRIWEWVSRPFRVSSENIRLRMELKAEKLRTEKLHLKSKELEKEVEILLGKERMNDNVRTLVRHLLASIDLSDIELDEMGTEERKEYVGVASAAYLNTLRREVKRLLKAQEEFVARQASPESLMFARGTVNGIMLVEEAYEEMHREHKANELEGKPETDQSTN